MDFAFFFSISLRFFFFSSIVQLSNGICWCSMSMEWKKVTRKGKKDWNLFLFCPFFSFRSTHHITTSHSFMMKFIFAVHSLSFGIPSFFHGVLVCVRVRVRVCSFNYSTICVIMKVYWIALFLSVCVCIHSFDTPLLTSLNFTFHHYTHMEQCMVDANERLNLTHKTTHRRWIVREQTSVCLHVSVCVYVVNEQYPNARAILIQFVHKQQSKQRLRARVKHICAHSNHISVY